MMSKLGRDNGVVLIFCAVVLPVLLLCLGLAIDSGFYSASMQEARASTRFLALSAVESYFDLNTSSNSSGQATTPTQRLDAALVRVNELARTYRLIGSGEHSEPLVYSTDPRSTASEIVLGRYYFDDIRRDQCRNSFPCQCVTGTDICNPCPEGEPPCFQPLSYAEVTRPNDPEPISSFKVKLRVERGLVAKFLGPMLGGNALPVSAESTSTLVPRRIMFLVDISDSITRETYIKRPAELQETSPELGRGSQYAFKVGNPDCPPCASSPCSECPLNPGSGLSDYNQWRILARSKNASGTYILPGLDRDNASPSSLAQNSNVHFFDDYSEVSPVYDPNNLPPDSGILLSHHPTPEGCNGGSATPRYCAPVSETYRVDLYCETAFPDPISRPAWCRGPQPLGDVIAGLDYAVNVFRNRLVAGDKIGLFFFDRTASWTRIIEPTDNFAYVQRVITSSDLRHLLKIFPGAENYTDIKMGVLEGFGQLARERESAAGAPSKDSLVLITDGMTNCSSCGGTGAGLANIDLVPDGVIDFRDLTLALGCFGCTVPPAGCPRCTDFNDISQILGHFGCAFNCLNDFPHYFGGMLDLKRFIQNTSHSGISLNILAVGNHIGPHLLDVANPNPASPQRCLTEAEIRALRLRSVDGTFQSGGNNVSCDTDSALCRERYLSASQDSPFYQALADLYDIARATGGAFQTLFNEMAGFCGETPDLCRTDPENQACCIPGNRWTSDKFCRTQQEQIFDFVDSIVSGQSPYIIVN